MVCGSLEDHLRPVHCPLCLTVESSAQQAGWAHTEPHKTSSPQRFELHGPAPRNPLFSTLETLGPPRFEYTTAAIALFSSERRYYCELLEVAEDLAEDINWWTDKGKMYANLRTFSHIFPELGRYVNMPRRCTLSSPFITGDHEDLDEHPQCNYKDSVDVKSLRVYADHR